MRGRTESELRAELREMIGFAPDGSRIFAADLAEKFGISKAYLSDVLNGKRGIADRLADAMGYERVVVFRSKVKAS
jgi:transcriptional regulator with XRE-family HTH domain